MQKKNTTNQPEPHKLDEALWSKILASKTVQGLAWKIGKSLQAEDIAKELVEMIVRKWSELVNVEHYFPDLNDLFTPEAIFRIEYAHQKANAKARNMIASRVHDVLAYISNLWRDTKSLPPNSSANTTLR